MPSSFGTGRVSREVAAECKKGKQKKLYMEIYFFKREIDGKILLSSNKNISLFFVNLYGSNIPLNGYL